MIKEISKIEALCEVIPDCLLAVGSVTAAAAAFGQIGFDFAKYMSDNHPHLIFGDYTPASLFAERILVGFEFSLATFCFAARCEYREGRLLQRILRANRVERFDHVTRSKRTLQATLLKGTMAAMGMAFTIYAAELTASFHAAPAPRTAATSPAARPAGPYYFENHK